MRKYFAFTLAEALIVLSIVAVLASISVVATNKSKPDEHIIMFRKAYATTVKAVQSLMNDTTLYPYADDPINSSALGSTGSNKKGLKGNGTNTASNNFAVNFLSKINTTSVVEDTSGGYQKSFYTPDGMYWVVEDYMHSDGYANIYIQTDTKGGGCYFSDECPVPTRFRLKVSYNGTVTPWSTVKECKDHMAVAYLRYSKLNKQSQFGDVSTND